jgi:hypothetical protein
VNRLTVCKFILFISLNMFGMALISSEAFADATHYDVYHIYVACGPSYYLTLDKADKEKLNDFNDTYFGSWGTSISGQYVEGDVVWDT